MSDQLPVDTSVITPVTLAGVGGVGGQPAGTQNPSGPAISAPPMTLTDQTFSTQTEIPNYLTQTTGPLPVNSLPTPPIAPASASANPGLPSIQVMFEQLKSSGVLLSDINIKAKVDTSLLAHLQPEQLVGSSQGPQPAFVVATQPPTASAIQLASTAPPVINPNSQHMAKYIEAHSRRPSTFVWGIVVGLVLVLLFIGGVMGYRYYLQMADASTNTTAQSYDALLDTLPVPN